MCNTPDAPAKKPDDRMNQGGNYWTLFTPGIWKVLHAVFQPDLRPLPDAQALLLGELLARREQLIGMLTAEQTRRQQLSAERIVRQIEAHLVWLLKQLSEVEAALDTAIRQTPLWQDKATLLARARVIRFVVHFLGCIAFLSGDIWLVSKLFVISYPKLSFLIFSIPLALGMAAQSSKPRANPPSL
jgi:hypothetical protein